MDLDMDRGDSTSVWFGASSGGGRCGLNEIVERGSVD